MQTVLSLGIPALIAWAAFRLRSLDRTGAFAAGVVGAAVLGMGGWAWALLLIAFFLSSSLLTHTLVTRKLDLEDSSSRGAGRDAGQVIGNGGLPAMIAVAHGLGADGDWTWPAFAAALAAVNADTWATELGALAARAPRLITRPGTAVPKGTSGGITAEGVLAGLAGATMISVLATVLAPFIGLPFTWITATVIAAAGLAGCLFDSLLGATIQVMYFCPTDAKQTEKHPLHTCGTPTQRVRGFRWLNNNLVNLACAAFGVVISLVMTTASG